MVKKRIVLIGLLSALMAVMIPCTSVGRVVHAESLGLKACTGSFSTAQATNSDQIKKVEELSKKETTGDMSAKMHQLLFTSTYRPAETGGKDWIKGNSGDPITSVYDEGLGMTVSWGWRSWGCFSYACFVSQYVRGTIGSGSIVSIGYESVPTAAEIKSFIEKYADPGEQIRYYYKSSYGYSSVHSVAYLASDSNGFYFLSESGDGLKVSVLYCTYSYLQSVLRVCPNDSTLKIYDTNGSSSGSATPSINLSASNAASTVTAKPTPRYTPDTSEYKVSFSRELVSRDWIAVMYGSDVRYMQACLYYLGYSVDIDGMYGKWTAAAVRQFQSHYGLSADGDIGRSTWPAIEKAVTANPSPVSQPEITTQPKDVIAVADSDVTFRVAAKGSGLKYQWYYRKKGQTDWTLWKGHTTASTTATSNSSWDGMQVRCLVSNSSGKQVYSKAAVITIAKPLKITSQPQSKTIASGESITLSVKAQGTGLSYQWYFKKKGDSSWSVWNTRTHASETVAPNATWNGIQLYCKVRDYSGKTLNSTAATVTFTSPAIAITAQPQNRTVSLGQSLTLSVKAQGKNLSYQWYFKKKGDSSWSLWKTRTHASETVTPNATWNGIQLYCKVRDSSGNTVNSAAATITVTPPAITITSQPRGKAINLGESLTLSVKAQGKSLSYQWYYKKRGASGWSIWNGHTHASESVTPNETWDGIQLYCRVKDSSGNVVKSDVAVVVVNS